MAHEVRGKCKPDFCNGLAHRLFMQHNNRCNLHSVFRDVGSTVGGFMFFIKPAMKTELLSGRIIVIYNVPSSYIH
jgi:hypothetical protein